MKTNRSNILIAIACAVLVVWIFSNPLRRSEESISRRLEKDTPLGSDPALVVAYVKSKGWPYYVNGAGDGRTKGDYIRVEIGEYRNIFITSVTVFWEFGDDSKLDRVRVWKTTDAL